MHDIRAGAILEGYSFSTASVKSLDSYQIWKMANDASLSHIWDACKHSDEFCMTEKEDQNLFELAHSSHDLNDKKMLDYWKQAHVVIDLSATDKQLIYDFSQWLKNFRKEIDVMRSKNFYTQKDFDYWIEYGVIPYLDLMLIAKIEGKKNYSI